MNKLVAMTRAVSASKSALKVSNPHACVSVRVCVSSKKPPGVDTMVKK